MADVRLFKISAEDYDSLVSEATKRAAVLSSNSTLSKERVARNIASLTVMDVLDSLGVGVEERAAD